MTLEELVNLIKIREYVVNSIGISTIDKSTVNMLNGMLLLLDKKIIEILGGSDFKEYIGYAEVDAAKKAARDITNIYSGIVKK